MATATRGSGEVQPARGDFLAMLERSREPLALLVPDARRVDRIVRIARTAWQLSPELRKCSPESVIASVMKAAELGLEPGGALRHAWLVPYGATCTFQLSYFGMLELARRSGEFKAIEAVLVRRHDEFEVVRDPEPRVVHRPHLGADAGPETHAYAYARLNNGALVLEVMTRDDIEHVRASSKCGPVWAKHWGEMAKKSVIKRLLKRQPCAVELAEAIEEDHRREYPDLDARAALPPGRGTAGLARALGVGAEATHGEPEFAEGTEGRVGSEDDEGEAPGREPGQDG